MTPKWPKVVSWSQRADWIRQILADEGIEVAPAGYEREIALALLKRLVVRNGPSSERVVALKAVIALEQYDYDDECT